MPSTGKPNGELGTAVLFESGTTSSNPVSKELSANLEHNQQIHYSARAKAPLQGKPHTSQCELEFRRASAAAIPSSVAASAMLKLG